MQNAKERSSTLCFVLVPKHKNDIFTNSFNDSV